MPAAVGKADHVNSAVTAGGGPGHPAEPPRVVRGRRQRDAQVDPVEEVVVILTQLDPQVIIPGAGQQMAVPVGGGDALDLDGPYPRLAQVGPVRPLLAGHGLGMEHRRAVAVITRVADSEDVDQAVVAERSRERADYPHAAPSVRGEGFAASLRQGCFKNASTRCLPRSSRYRAKLFGG